MSNSKIMRLMSYALTLFLCLLSIDSFAKSKLNVAFINPDRQGNPFWDSVTEFMQEVAIDLDIDLDVYYIDKDRFSGYQKVNSLLKSEDQPDYLLYIYQAGTGKRILDMAEEAGIRSFLFNTDIHPKEKDIVGMPRERYKYWIGHMYPDDRFAGELLASSLLAQAASLKVFGNDGRLGVLAVSGGLDSAVSGMRNNGLTTAISKFGLAELKQLVYAQWDPDIALRQIKVLKGRYPDARIIWSASDDMAISIAKDFSPGNNYVIGGIDWTEQALQAIRSGQIHASVGGHYMEGGWALIMLHDYHMGKDFSTTMGLTIKTNMSLIHQGNVEQYIEQLRKNHYQGVDFKRFSKVYTLKERSYDFSLEALMQAAD